jgi:HTH-type transcriptional regulator/antitoxin HigA
LTKTTWSSSAPWPTSPPPSSSCAWPYELGHLHLHLLRDDLAFFDDVEQKTYGADEPDEHEANTFARDLYIAPEKWRQHEQALSAAGQDADIVAAADALEISPAIVAGRLRWETSNYAQFSKLIGRGKVRELFCCPSAHSPA